MTTSRMLSLALVLTGVAIGALVFSQFTGSPPPAAYSKDDSGLPESSANHPADQPITSLRDLNRAFVSIAKEVNPTVVTVFTEKVFKVRQRRAANPFFDSPFDDFFNQFFDRRQPGTPHDREYRQRGLGSGVIVSESGYILTNNHVVQDADTIFISMLDDKHYPARVIGTDPKTDIAVLKIDAGTVPAITIGDSDRLEVGEWVLAIGSPLSATLAHTVTSGIVSAKGRSNVGLAEYEDFIQTDAAINPGNSGGALINLDGELVGINAAIASRSGGYQGIGFAVPVNMARRVMESIIDHGTVIRGWLGVSIQDIDETLAEAMDLSVSEGALIAEVTDNSPAARAGLQERDIVVELDGKKIMNSTELRNEIASRSPGTTIELKVLRDGGYRRMEAVLSESASDEVAADEAEKIEQLFGFTVATMNRDLAEQYNLDPSLEGAVVTGINRTSSAFRAGLNEGDLIAAVYRKTVRSVDDFAEAVRKADRGDSVYLRIVRQNRSFYVAFTL